MNRSTRMMLLNSGRDIRDREPRRRRVGVEYEDWTPMDHYGARVPTTAPYMPMEPEDAFYDDRGRRHYDNGRYAPMNSYGSPEMARRYRRDSDGRFAPRSEYYPMLEPWGASDRRMDTDHSPRMIGFGRSWDSEPMRSDATMPQLVEMDRLRGRRSQNGMAYGESMPKFDQRMAMEWVEGMQNADGTHGPHWPLEKTKEIQKQYNIDCDPIEFFAVLNSIYSDYCEALKKNNASTLDTYVCLAKAWIKDDDAVPDKAAAYFTYVVEH